MTKYLAGVLTVIAVGVLLVAYGLLGSRASALEYSNPSPYGMQQVYGQQPPYGYDNPYMRNPDLSNPYMTNRAMAVPANSVQPVRAIETVQTAPVAPRRIARSTRTIERAPGRDWKRTAMIVGGTSAVSAGVGGLIGGKKGALIGAAIGGGASTIYETTRNR